LNIEPFYTQYDEWQPSAEAIIRNCLFGKRRAEAFGGGTNAGYLPDNFGHPPQMPQILNNFGIDSLLFMRGLPEISGEHPDEFLYEGLDSSRIWCSHFRESYSGAFDIYGKDIDLIQPREVPYYNDYLSYEWHRELVDHDDPKKIADGMIKNVLSIQSRYPSGIIPLIAGGDHMPPQINIGDSVKRANLIQDYSIERWYNVAYAIDTSMKTFSLFIDGKKVLGNKGFQSPSMSAIDQFVTASAGDESESLCYVFGQFPCIRRTKPRKGAGFYRYNACSEKHKPVRTGN